MLFYTTDFYIQLAFKKCWAHSPLRAAARRLFYIAIHQVSLLSHAACASMSTTTTTTKTTTTTTTRDRGDRYGPIEWAQLWYTVRCFSLFCIICTKRTDIYTHTHIGKKCRWPWQTTDLDRSLYEQLSDKCCSAGTEVQAYIGADVNQRIRH